ncbi:tRNA(fMet)-specific endonuclease VapC [Rhizomicrobium palustre]|uniref:Ribonuclease VapC n=1 Tax=Rhizomicrobium palustre TaxID=189966 RepID=A0A846MV50_9PROT|nr:type II toxin-antitoxin system VapC family toxin [Rhizomicrobium palustre]NIK87061.1 tRNA(fMet)-specific endonuclease VapC [Rhizomicrobium palustre]
MYLLDTNIVSDILRNPRGRAAAKVRSLAEGEAAVSIIVASELRFGVQKKGAPALESLVEGFLLRVPVLPLAMPADRLYAKLRCDLEIAGTPISANDMLIAAHALALDATLVTDNEREFSRVEGLKLENWLH